MRIKLSSRIASTIGIDMINILIVDDQEFVSEGLAALLGYHPDIKVVGTACNGRQACKLAGSLNPDVILMDIRMPEMDGIAATEAILSEHPEIKVLVLTTFDEDDLIVNALKAGASGYLLKDTKSDRIAQAIQTVHGGGLILSPTAASKVVSQLSAVRSIARRSDLKEKLSGRKLEVLKLIGQGKSNSEIAQVLYLSEGTVKNYVSQIFEQLGVRDRVQAALIAQQELL